MAIYRAGSKGKLHVGAAKVKRVYQGDVKVYSSGNVCTYHVDAGSTYMEEVDEGVSCLSPGTFIPAKAGWEFVGWREDQTASSSVLTGKVMGDDPITLYAVFRQAVTLTTVANGTTNRETKPRLYNNGNLVDPVFTVASPARSGATFKGWSASAGSTTISNNSISTLSLTASTARYAVFTYAAAYPKFISDGSQIQVLGDTIHYHQNDAGYGRLHATIPGCTRPVVFTRSNTQYTHVTSLGTVFGTTQSGNAGGTFNLTIYSDFEFGETITLSCPAYSVVG